MVILLDLDGVVYDLHTEWFRRYNERTGDDLTPERVRGWGTHKYTKYGESVYTDLIEPGVWFDGPIIPGAYNGVRKLLDAGHEIYFASALCPTSPTCAYEKGEWINRHYPQLGSERLILTKQKHLIRGDVLVDDLWKNLENFDGYRILFNQPWNESINARKDGMLRAMDWNDVVEYIGIYNALYHYRNCQNNNRFKDGYYGA